MTVDIPFQRLARTGFPMVLCAVALLYFGFHAVGGDNGLQAWFAVNDKITKVEQELDVTRTERQRLEQKVSLMHPESLDGDMLDEAARHTLGLSHPDDLIILLKE
jgi:cell division protein FtsB